jgi:hypothetical protein
MAIDSELHGGLSQIVENHKRRQTIHQRRSYSIISLITLAILGGGAWLLFRDGFPFQIVGFTIVIMGYVFEVWALHYASKRLLSVTLPVQLLNLIGNLESHPEAWNGSLTERRAFVRQLEHLAVSYESIPLSLRTGDVTTNETVSLWMRGIAARIRGYKLWVLHPVDFTYTDLIHELAEDCRLVLADQWHRLRRGEFRELRKAPTKKARVGWALLGLLLIAGFVGAGVLSSRLGPVAPYLVTMAGAAAFLALGNAGLSTQSFMEARKAAEGIGRAE